MTLEEIRQFALEDLMEIGVPEGDLFLPEVDPVETEDGYWVKVEYFIPKSSIDDQPTTKEK